MKPSTSATDSILAAYRTDRELAGSPIPDALGTLKAADQVIAASRRVRDRVTDAAGEVLKPQGVTA